MALKRIRDLPVCNTPNLGDGALFEVEGSDGNSGYIQFYQIRAQLGGLTLGGDLSGTTAQLGTTLTATIGSKKVTPAKMADSAANTVLGYDASGVAVNVTAGTNVTISGNQINMSAPATAAPSATMETWANNFGF